MNSIYNNLLTNLFKRVKNKFKRNIIDLLINTNNQKLLFKESGGKSIIAMYHGVDKTENKTYNLRFIGIKNFEKQLLYFKKYCNIVSIEDYVTNNIKQDKFNITLTFDDGYLNNYKYVYPILIKYDIPATFFITSIKSKEEDIFWADFFDIFTTLYDADFVFDNNIRFKKNNNKYYLCETNKTLNEYLKEIGDFLKIKEIMNDAFRKIDNFKNREDLEDYWKLMGDNEIREIASSDLITIGSHGIYHNRLDLINEDDLKQQLNESKKYLENITCKEVNTLAFPCGYYNENVINIAKQLGYKYQFAADYESNLLDNKIVFGRYGIYPAVSWQNIIYDLIKNKTYGRI